MLSLCYSGLLFGAVSIAVFVVGTVSWLISRHFYKKDKSSTWLYRTSKVYVLSVAYYVIATVLYVAIMFLNRFSDSYVSCSEREGLELLVFIVAVIAMIITSTVVYTGNMKQMIHNKLYVSVARVLVIFSLLSTAVIIYLSD
jgi:heme/copper-type cytochrome/quinol oxidase subunit 2